MLQQSNTTSMSAWKARVRGLNNSEQSINTEATPIRDTQGTRPSGVFHSEMNTQRSKLLMNCIHSIPAEKNIFCQSLKTQTAD